MRPGAAQLEIKRPNITVKRKCLDITDPPTCWGTSPRFERWDAGKLLSGKVSRFLKFSGVPR